MVVRAPEGDVDLTCGGVPMYDPRTEEGPVGEVLPELRGGSQLGKRCLDDAGSLELLDTRPGVGTLTVDGRPLLVQAAKSLPASGRAGAIS